MQPISLSFALTVEIFFALILAQCNGFFLSSSKRPVFGVETESAHTSLSSPSLPLRATSLHCINAYAFPARLSSQIVVLYQSRDWIDEVSDDELRELSESPSVKPDMKYLPRNVMRQNQNFVAIREAAGKELTHDIYVREPNSQVFWFVGKIARVSDVTPAQAVSRQWNLIETHAANLRPIELFPGRGSLELWMAPGDSEMEVAYNRPDIVFEKMSRDVEGADALKSILMGFQGEMYEGGEHGFRTWRNDDGTPAKPEIQSPGPQTENEILSAPSENEMGDIQKMLENKDINEIYKEQQRRAGKPVEDD